VKKNALTKIRCVLKTEIQKAGKTSPTMKLRLSNIQWIRNLPRKGLSYQKKERQLLIHTTDIGGKIFIQYPGKESIRKDEKQRPWDFRPRLYRAQDNNHHFDMSFGDIFKAVCGAADTLGGKDRKNTLRIFAAILYRMAFMIDHVEIKHFRTRERDVIYKNNGKFKLSTQRKKELPALFKYKPGKQTLEYITKRCPKWGEMSFEGFLFYYELLAWNEDCKYYYQNYYIKNNKGWINSKGRINTLLTGIRIVGHLLGDISLPDLINRFSMGISPATNDEVVRICRDFVKVR